MFLCEEYFHRHRLNVPIIRHVQSGSFFLKTNEQIDYWRVITIEWLKSKNNSPYEYRIRTHIPRYDIGNLEITDRFNIRNTWTGGWDQFEKYIKSLLKDYKNCTPIIGPRNVTMAAWEMFLFNHDSWVAENLNNDKIYSTVDLDLPMDVRYRNLQEVCLSLSSSHKYLFGIWKGHLLRYLDNYCDWLGYLMERDDEEILSS